MPTPEERAYPLLFLVSDATSYVSESCLVVDAGDAGGCITGRIDPPALPSYDDMRSEPVAG